MGGGGRGGRALILSLWTILDNVGLGKRRISCVPVGCWTTGVSAGLLEDQLGVVLGGRWGLSVTAFGT